MTDSTADRLRRRLGLAGSPVSADVDTAPIPLPGCAELDVAAELDTTADPDTAAGPGDDDPRSLLPHWLPDTSENPGWLASVRADPGRAGLIALGAVAALAVLVTVFTLLGEDTPPVSSAKLPPVAPVADTAAPGPRSAPGTSAAPEGPIVVSVVGLVNTPGLVTLAPGARVADALSAAGGTVAKADTTGLNLARRLADGEQVLVGIAAAPGRPAALGSSVGAGPPASPPAGPPAGPPGTTPETPAKPRSPAKPTAPAAPVNLNTASSEELDALPGVGPVTAAAIIAWREANGGFASVDQLAEVDGIGDARLSRLRDLVRV